MSGPRTGRPKKRYGQHFLKDPNTARIVASDIAPDDVVLEVGPGRGFLTAFLCESAEFVHAVEIDEDVLPYLTEATAGRENVQIHIGDALAFDYASLSSPPNRLVANLPYNVASPLLLRLLEDVPSLKTLRFMVQLEVARRITASRGTKDYATYAVLVRLLAEAKLSHKVPPTVFDPPPRVNSAVVELRRREDAPSSDEYSGVKKLVVAAFSNRRKRLVNNLDARDKTVALDALEKLGKGRDARAEELSPEDFIALYGKLSL